MVAQIPSGVNFDLKLIKKYDTPTPRYTSYPPATELREDFNCQDFVDAIARSNARQTPLSLYFHIPFCQSACYFCGCNVIVTNSKNVAQPYVEYLVKEIQQTSQNIDKKRPVTQLHWGGGTPNFLTLQQTEFLWKHINKHFQIDENAELSLEVNPRYVDKDYIFFLRELGFNRISFGIQDFNPEVQAAINRVQPEEMLFNVMEWVRDAGFSSVNVDLIYGLPHQNLKTFNKTIQKTIELNPDRIAVFNFAYVPWVKPVQKNIPKEALPAPEERLEILQMTVEELTHSHYLFIGMDHFAKPTDELALALQQGTLKRNFQGYTALGNAELFGFGATSVSMLEDTYAQNYKRLKDYYQAVDNGMIPTHKGYNLSKDDMIRRDVIMSIMSGTWVEKGEIEQQYQISFDDYFAYELPQLEKLETDGLVDLSASRIKVTPIGRLLVRNIAVIFDAHKKQRDRILSRAI